MKVEPELEKKLESLFQQYEEEVNEAKEKSYLKETTANTYLTHSWNFIKWCKGNFEPGGKNKN